MSAFSQNFNYKTILHKKTSHLFFPSRRSEKVKELIFSVLPSDSRLLNPSAQ